MSWADRLLEAAYTSPGGTRLTFDYEDVRKTVEKKGTAFGFADADGTYIQERGHTGQQIPMRVILWGEDYDLKADAFDALLLERGTGKLEHPKYGTVDVVPFGAITRRDDLKTAANQAIIEVTFWETTGLLYPSSQSDPAGSVLSAVSEYNDSMAEEFADVLGFDSTVQGVNFRNEYLALLDTAEGGLQALADVQDDVRVQFNAIVDSINTGIDVLISQPLTLAFQTALLIQAPARALANIEARLSAYRDLADSVLSNGSAAASPDRQVASNVFRTRDLYASTYVSGAVLSTVNAQFTTKTEAITAAQFVLARMDEVTVWRDDNFTAIAALTDTTIVAQVDTGTSYQQLQEAVALCAGFLVEISFSLKQERRVVLDRDRNFVDLCAELYGQTDEVYNFFILSNDLSGDEYTNIERGREIVYYI